MGKGIEEIRPMNIQEVIFELRRQAFTLRTQAENLSDHIAGMVNGPSPKATEAPASPVQDERDINALGSMLLGVSETLKQAEEALLRADKYQENLEHILFGPPKPTAGNMAMSGPTSSR
ncbi:MAG: hypothetical protein PHQ43_14845 [Dehalococcoidales bacterium]|nr:hypothetical protein [Dehalococcoidales bacterium]